jgi:hypothetical protein
MEHDGLGMTAEGTSTMLKRLGKATRVRSNHHGFRRGFAVRQMKSGLANKVIRALGGWESPHMASHYAATLTFDDALQLCKQVNGREA